MKFSVATAALLLISLLFNLAIAIYTIVAGSTGWVNTNLGCRGEYDGVMGTFNHIDTYLQQIDQAMCSDVCPCFITNTTAFTNNATVRPFYELWEKSPTPGPQGAIAFQNCTTTLQQYSLSEAKRRNLNFAAVEEFDPIEFYDYFNKLETEFQCSGWCEIQYFNANYGQNVLMSKYLFSDINRGPPVNFGCLNPLITWLPPYLHAFASMTMVLFGTQILLLSLLLCQIWAREKDHEKQIPHHHDDNRA